MIQSFSRFDAALTCPEPWSHVNRSMKLLEVNVCHLTQFAFFFSFYGQNGLILFDKNNSGKPNLPFLSNTNFIGQSIFDTLDKSIALVYFAKT